MEILSTELYLKAWKLVYHLKLFFDSKKSEKSSCNLEIKKKMEIVLTANNNLFLTVNYAFLTVK